MKFQVTYESDESEGVFVVRRYQGETIIVEAIIQRNALDELLKILAELLGRQ